MSIEVMGRKRAHSNIRLDDLIGLDAIKKELRKIEAMLWLNTHRRSEDLLELSLQAFHFSFRGNPGTGKTTVARLIGDIFHRYGILRVGDVVEVDRSKLIGPTPGETEAKTRKILRSALDGVLFIDEAYSLLGSGDSSDPGIRALEVILKGMEDYRDALIVVFAGYPHEMDSLFDAVTGLKSRVPYHLEFPDYSPRELVDIAIFMANNEKLEFSDEASRALLKITEKRSSLPDFSNARDIRNLLDQAKARLSARLQSRRKVSQWDMKVLTAMDLEDEGSEVMSQVEEAKREMYRSPSDASARSRYAEICSKAGLWTDVAAIIEPIKEMIDEETAALYGRALYNIGERNRAWEIFSRIGSTSSGSFYQALSALWSGENSTASTLASEAARMEPGNPDTLFSLSAVKFFAGEFSESAESFESGLAVAGSTLPPRVLRDLPFDNIPWPESASNLRKALYFAYGYPDKARLLFTESLIDSGVSGALLPAETIISKCIERVPDDPSAHRMMSIIHTEAGRTAEAAASLEIALELEPRNTEDWRRLASLLESLGETQRTEEIYREILEEDSTGGAGLKLARSAETKGDKNKAERLYRKAWDSGLSGEDRALCAVKLGTFAASAGNFVEGSSYFRQAGDLSDKPEAAFWFARALVEEDKWQDAENLLMIPSDRDSVEHPRFFWLSRLFVVRRNLFSARNMDWGKISDKYPRPYLRLVRGLVSAMSGDPGADSLLMGLPETGMGIDAISMLGSARASMKDWEEVRRLGRISLNAGYGPFLWERQIRRPREELGYLSSIADAHLGDWDSAHAGFRRSAATLRHPGPLFALGVSLVALGNVDEAKLVQNQIKISSPPLSRKLEELISQNSGIRKLMADPIDPGVLDLSAFI